MGEWHRAGALPVDRAREIARTCWQALRRVDPEAARLIAIAAAASGEYWLTPQVSQYTMDDVVTPLEAAELVGRSVRWVYQWVAQDRPRRAVVGHDGRIRVRVRDILESVAGERRRTPSGHASHSGHADDGRVPRSMADVQEDLAAVFDNLGEHDLAARQREIANSLREGEPP